MNRPPLWLRVKVREPEKDFGLWLPLFLLIPVVLVVLIILSPLILIAAILLWPTGWGKIALMSIPTADAAPAFSRPSVSSPCEH